MKRYGLFALLLSLSSTVVHAYNVVGEAFSLDDQRLVYREYHLLDDNGLTREVRYFSPEEELIAEKYLQYSDVDWQPSFQQVDHRSKETIRVNVEANAVRVDVSSTMTQLDGRIAKSEELVIDAGFDAFVKTHWQALAEGKALVIEFALPARQRAVELVIRKAETAQCMNRTDILCLKIAANNWLLRAFVDPLWLSYDRQSRRLLAFQGVANVRDARGESQAVRILYRYIDEG